MAHESAPGTFKISIKPPNHPQSKENCSFHTFHCVSLICFGPLLFVCIIICLHLPRSSCSTAGTFFFWQKMSICIYDYFLPGICACKCLDRLQASNLSWTCVWWHAGSWFHFHLCCLLNTANVFCFVCFWCGTVQKYDIDVRTPHCTTSIANYCTLIPFIVILNQILATYERTVQLGFWHCH